MQEGIGEGAVDLHEQAPIDGALGVVEREGKQILLERLNGATPEVDLQAQPRRTHDELLVRGGSHHTPEEDVRFFRLTLAEQELGELEIDGEQALVLRDRSSERGDGA